MITISESIVFDTNEFIFGLRNDPNFPSCATLLNNIGSLKIYIPRQIVRELQNNLHPNEVNELFRLFSLYPGNIHVSWQFAENEKVVKFMELGCKLGDAAVAAHLEIAGIKLLISENRHFLSEISNLPFEVMSSKEYIAALNF